MSKRLLKVTSTTDAADWSALLAQFHSQYTKMADALRERVRSGAYASESEVIRDGLRALFARDQAVDAWLREEVAASYDALIADPNDVATADDVRSRLATRHAARR